jgi:hypothetical protein
MMYERTAISKKPELTIINDLKQLREENKMSPDLFFKDPYVLDFLGLKDTYSEKDLENAILGELEEFKPEHKEQVELLELDSSGIHVAQYLTQMPPKEVFEEKLHKAIQRAKSQLEQRGQSTDI